LSALVGVIVGLLLCLLPLRFIQEANPDWRPLNWVHTSMVVAITLCVAAYLGGWPWMRHFAPPLILIFFALPWTLIVEQSVIQSMARAVASITVEILNWAGVPSLQSGNVIEVPTGPVGIADACSGVRSFAGTLMASVFFGEFYRLGWGRRLILVAIGVAIAFGLNLVRTSTLSWVAATRGLEAIASWHDQTGLLIFCVAFGALWFTGKLLARPIPAPTGVAPALSQMPHVSIPLTLTIAFWLLLTQIGTEAWYRVQERNLPHSPTWNFIVPERNPSFQTVAVSDEARAILRYSEGCAAEFNQPGQPVWEIHYFRWEPGRSSSQLAVLHRPEICLTATGLKIVSSKSTQYVTLAGVTIPFESTIFDAQGTPLYVFRTLCEDRRPLGSTSGFDQSVAGRLQSAWHGRRNLGQKLLQVGIFGPENQQVALADLQARLPKFLVITE
jgi:exosortase